MYTMRVKWQNDIAATALKQAWPFQASSATRYLLNKFRKLFVIQPPAQQKRYYQRQLQQVAGWKT
jgi:hypothetical protein